MSGKNIQTYPFLNSRKKVWQPIIQYVSKDCGFVDSVLELGPGFCDFINNFPARKKYCVEKNSAMQKYADKSVEFLSGNALNLKRFPIESLDLIFASNFLEHLTDEEHKILIPQIHSILKKSGKLVLIQPNFSLCKANYFDDVTHVTIFSATSIVEFLKDYNFHIEKIIPGFLPFSMKSKLPKISLLVKLYLISPIRPLAAQMYVVAAKKFD